VIAAGGMLAGCLWGSFMTMGVIAVVAIVGVLLLLTQLKGCIGPLDLGHGPG
jgi:hypothetical protein